MSTRLEIPSINTHFTFATIPQPIPPICAGDTDPNEHGREAESGFRLSAEIPAKFNVRDPTGVVGLFQKQYIAWKM